MKNKNILITGASSGIGKEIAQHLHNQGANVVLVARNEAKLNKMVSEFGENAYAYPYDLTNLEDILNIFEFCREKNMKLDGMIHCAGIIRKMAIKNNFFTDMQESMILNCESFIEMGKYFGNKKYSNDLGGSIIAISSLASLECEKSMGNYSSSKAALNASVKVMAKEYIQRKIRVNAILPGYVNTGMFVAGAALGGDIEGKVSDNQPLGAVEPEYIAYLCEFLISDKSKYISGSLIPVSGGYTY